MAKKFLSVNIINFGRRGLGGGGNAYPQNVDKLPFFSNPYQRDSVFL